MKHIAPLTAQSVDPELQAAWMQLIMLFVTDMLPLIQTIMSLKGPAAAQA